MQYKKKKKSKSNKFLGLEDANLYLTFSSNNLILTLTDLKGDTVAFSSPSLVGFKNNRKSTLFAMKAAALDMLDKCKKFSVKNVNIIVNGSSRNINEILKLIGATISVLSMREATVLAFNGTRLRNKRRT